MLQVETEIMAYLRRVATEGGNAVEVTPDTRLLGSGLLDSMGMVGLIGFLDDHISLTIPDADLDPGLVETPRTISTYVARKLGVAA